MALNRNKLGYYGDEQRLGFIRDAMEEHRMDVIGQNGNDGLHYDEVSHPEHYQSNNPEVDIECIEAIKAALTPEEFRGYCKGAAFKYIWRERGKGGIQSLRKATEYLSMLDNTR